MDSVVDYVVREYQVDTAGAREALLGLAPGIEDELAQDIVARAGPWGAVRR